MRKESCALIPMRDGVQLAAEIWRADDTPRPGIVMRTPYGRVDNDMQPYVDLGYVVIVVDGRATGASEGDYDYYNMQAGKYDGYDLIEWLAEQTWCNGRIAAMGGSACGIYAILTAAEKPPHLQCMLIDVVPADFYHHQWYPGGVLRNESRRSWCFGIANRCAPGSVWDAEENDYVQRAHKSALSAQRYQQADSQILAWSDQYFTETLRNDFWDTIDL
ncbi:MAG: CocE/NonD family hydrolase, partial [Planctomycetes bacterium]|nr:CocE/NonD family hydrolase [Planctomycetota bacterium]